VTSASSTVRVYGDVLGDRSLRRVMLAFLLFNAGEFAIWIAVTLFAYDQGGATTAGLVLIAQLVPAALIAPVASTFGDRLRRDRALALGYLIQAGANLLLGVALMAGPPLAAYGAAVIASCSITLTRPVHNALLPQLATTPSQLTAANSVSGTVEGIGILVGPISNSILIAVSGPAAVAFVYAGVMVLASVLVVRLRLTNTTDDAPGDHGGLLAELAEGARALAEDRPAATLTLLGGAQFVMVGLLDVFYAVLAIDVLGSGEEMAGLLAASVGLGGLFGAAATAVLVGRRRLAGPIELALGAAGGAVAAVSLVTAFGPIVLLLAVAGAARSFFDVAARTLLQRSVDDDVIARVFGVQEGLIMLALAVGSALAPVFIAAFGEQGSLVAAGAVLPAFGLLAWGSLARLDRRAVIPDEFRQALLRGIPIFDPLPQYELERVARQLQPMVATAGTEIIREGDIGDRFYVLVSGQAVVETDDRKIVDRIAGAYFGEIALLRDVPRTATVRAVTDCELFALERDDFLAAVTGRRVAPAVDAEIDRRLSELEGPPG
jgi:predicted MFS family arabinose efflux permease